GEYEHAMRLLHPPGDAWVPPVRLCSALDGTGISEIWDTVGEFAAAARTRGGIDGRRAAQARAWMWSEIGEDLMTALRADARVKARVKTLEAKVTAGKTTPSAAAREILALFLDRAP
ncbi:MAG: methylmalonyl Co-A mutase-associated GTPase MeaB, partial [Alphaproteobacteria bacterium]